MFGGQRYNFPRHTSTRCLLDIGRGGLEAGATKGAQPEWLCDGAGATGGAGASAGQVELSRPAGMLISRVSPEARNGSSEDIRHAPAVRRAKCEAQGKV